MVCPADESSHHESIHPELSKHWSPLASSLLSQVHAWGTRGSHRLHVAARGPGALGLQGWSSAVHLQPSEPRPVPSWLYILDRNLKPPEPQLPHLQNGHDNRDCVTGSLQDLNK